MNDIAGVRVFCPSFKRAEVRSSTQEYLPWCRLVVAESAAGMYRDSGNDVVACPDKVQGNASRVRNWILDQNQDARGVLLLDDDISWIGRWSNGIHKKLTRAEVEEFIDHGYTLAEEWGAPFWGVNLNTDKSIYQEYAPFSTTRPILGPFQAHRPSRIRYDEDLPLKEDYDISIQYLNEFRKILRFNMYHYACKQNKQIGGCSAYRTIDRERAQFLALQKKWGTRIVKAEAGNHPQKVSRKAKTVDINPKVIVPIRGI